MSRLTIPTVDTAPEATNPLLAAVKKQLGVVPNLMKLVGNSPAALEGYLSLNGALAKGTLDTKLRERIALGVAEFNGCDYCLAAHSYLGANVAKLNQSELDAARDSHSERGARGGAIDDRLHPMAARKAQVQALVTLDTRDFKALAKPTDPETRSL